MAAMLEQGVDMDVVLTGRDELRRGKERKERKGHCGYLGVNDNQNITPHNCSEFLFFRFVFFFHPSAGLPHPNQSKQMLGQK